MEPPLTIREELMVLYIRTLMRRMGYERHVIDEEIEILLKPLPFAFPDDTTKNQTQPDKAP